MKKQSFTVVIPAHNEEKYIARCIFSVKAAAKHYGGNVEIIVVCNRCTDNTAEIAKKCGARVLYNDERCIASVRNTGIFAASGEIIVTIDADNRMTRGTLKEIAMKLSHGMKFVRIDLYQLNGTVYFGEYTFFHGGGFAPFKPDKWERRLGDWINLEISE